MVRLRGIEHLTFGFVVHERPEVSLKPPGTRPENRRVRAATCRTLRQPSLTIHGHFTDSMPEGIEARRSLPPAKPVHGPLPSLMSARVVNMNTPRAAVAAAVARVVGT